jgi:hypothetical protein
MHTHKLVDGKLIELTREEQQSLNERDKKSSLEELSLIKSKKIDSLWKSATKYETKYISNTASYKVLIRSSEGDLKCKHIENWIDEIWKEYYRKKEEVETANSSEIVYNISEDFSHLGPIPHTIKEALS